MKSTESLILLACVGLLAGCAAAVPSELVSARQAYQHASAGRAAQAAPTELQKAHDALTQAEQAFSTDPDSYHARDLAYVAERKSEMADAFASIAIEQGSRAQANSDYRETQSDIVQQTKRDLSQTRTDLAESERSGEKTAGQLSAEREELSQTRADLAASERSGERAADQLSAERTARLDDADKRAADAQAALAKLAAVSEESRGLVITLSGSVLFRSGEATLLPDARARLEQVADALLAIRERNLVVDGHTDSNGSEAYNLGLSQRRADTVRGYLVQRGYPADRIQAHGMGQRHPIANNTTAEGRANNRRVEIIVERGTTH